MKIEDFNRTLQATTETLEDLNKKNLGTLSPENLAKILGSLESNLLTLRMELSKNPMTVIKQQNAQKLQAVINAITNNRLVQEQIASQDGRFKTVLFDFSQFLQKELERVKKQLERGRRVENVEEGGIE